MKNVLTALLLMSATPALAFPWEGAWAPDHGRCVSMTAKSVFVDGKKVGVAKVAPNKVGGWNLTLADGRFVEIEFNDADSLAVTIGQTIIDMAACRA